MDNNFNFIAEERKAGNKAAITLRASIRSKIKSDFHSRSGAMEKSNVSARYRSGGLDRLVLLSPHYSFKQHFGSSLTGKQNESSRTGGSVKTFQRHIKGKTVTVSAHERIGANVKSFNKNRRYTAVNHISEALKSTSALNILATELGRNRMILITSQIDF